ncbi:unnamed protein product [Plutella xylostella]|uniref:(diamondback moth) hypothetical protein n=1 Tax=Plutella xylostella TaxID=51655 RepID=A0A8S4EFR8_PLUXY|nr:unnamed protein product [Plutella xylostella]
MAVWSNEATTQFISLYKSHTCLWKVKSSEYKNRKTKKRAYEDLVRFCKSIGFHEASEDTVRRKINCLRGCFRKELRKIVASLKNGQKEEDAYKPNLWYFDQLMFTKDHDIEEGGTYGDDDGDHDDDNDDNEDDTNSNDSIYERKPTIEVSVPYTSNTAAFGFQSSQNEKNVNSGSPTRNGGENDNEISKYARADKGVKRRLQQPAGYIGVCSGGMTLADISETEAFGIMVARKLQRMGRDQALYAETIINTVLRKGITNKLTEETDVCDNHCERNFLG